MTIIFVHNNKAFLPETEAYLRFFSRYGIHCECAGPDEAGLLHRDVEWRLMGTDFQKPREGIFRIHEYSSSSVPPYRKWKNWAKGFFNAQPDFRLFLNEYVRRQIGIHDRIPFGYRDMGVPAEWLHLPSIEVSQKKYDFVYLGDLSPVREPERMLELFRSGSLKNQSLLVLGTRFEKLAAEYAACGNIAFQGPVEHADIPFLIRQARFALNFMADKEPLNRQTSTKFLEYAACGLPIVTTTYAWALDFRNRYGGEYCFIQPDLSDLTWEKVTGTPFKSPDLRSWTWDEQIRKSGVLQFLQSHFEELQF